MYYTKFDLPKIIVFYSLNKQMISNKYTDEYSDVLLKEIEEICLDNDFDFEGVKELFKLTYKTIIEYLDQFLSFEENKVYPIDELKEMMLNVMYYQTFIDIMKLYTTKEGEKDAYFVFLLFACCEYIEDKAQTSIDHFFKKNVQEDTESTMIRFNNNADIIIFNIISKIRGE